MFEVLSAFKILMFVFFSEILALGFNEKFIRTWEYYFDYCAAGFKSHTLGNYQVQNLSKNVQFFFNPLVLASEKICKSVIISCNFY